MVSRFLLYEAYRNVLGNGIFDAIPAFFIRSRLS